MSRLTVVVLGIAGQSPFAGVAWQALHYVEDTGEWPFDPERNAITDDPAYTVGYLGRLMAERGLGERWAYRSAAREGRVFGLSDAALAQVLARADVLVNVTAATVLRDEHLRVPVRIYLETDPVLPQIEIAQGTRFTIDFLGAHTHHCTFGENLGTPWCPIPTGPFAYRPTRQPVVLDWWAASGRAGSGRLRLTTVASWRQTGKDIAWNGQVYAWSKHRQFARFVEVPRGTGADFELALTRVDPGALAQLRANGWTVEDAVALSREPKPYRDYIQASGAEFTVAKDQYVLPRSGWFSDRSACYLAAGKPVVTQDTGFGRVLPTGRGLFAFDSIDGARAAVDAIAADYARHAAAAREIAAEYFGAERVLARLLATAGL